MYLYLIVSDCIWLAGCGFFFRQVSVTLVMTTDSAAAVGGRAGITFGVELVVPWDAPEAVVMDLETVPDVIGLTGPPTMATHGAPSYGVATAGPGYYACGGQETFL